MSSTYKAAGVDLALYEQTMSRLPRLLKRTHTARVMALSGGFAGLFRLQSDEHRYRDPVLVSGSDGVGTKIKVAILAERFNSIGIDLVAMCVNDCLCLGAEPLFFLDYLALPTDAPDLVEQLVEGVSAGCLQAGAALLGGETAIMPDLYAAGDFDMAGFCVGVCERDLLLDGSSIAAGDIVLGLPSSGFHSNGFSLVRRVVFDQLGLSIDDEVPELQGSLADVLLTPTTIYAEPIKRLRAADVDLHGIAHITGGGLAENLTRILPSDAGLQVEIPRGWNVPPEMTWLQQAGGIAAAEMERVFNMGIGMAIVMDSASQELALQVLREAGSDPILLGQVKAGERGVRLVG